MATDKILQNLELPGIPTAKKRGRPSTGKAMTPAERKQAQRERDTTRLMEETNLNNVTDTGLITLLARGDGHGYKANGPLARAIWEEIGKRRGFIA